MTDENTHRILPIELSSIVTAVVGVTRELTRRLNREEANQVITELCEQLRSIPNDQRGPGRPFTG